MNKASLIGLLLGLAWTAAATGHPLPAKNRTGSGSDAPVLLSFAQSPSPGRSENQGQIDTRMVVFTLVMATAMLMLSAYLFFLVKKQQLLSEQSEKLRHQLSGLFEHAPCGYHSLDEQGYFLNINRTLLGWLGYEKEEVVRKLKFADIVDEKDRGKLQDLSSLTNDPADIELIKKTGATFPVILRALSQEAIRGQEPAILFTTIDNSLCKQALERIKTLDQELEAFSYSISHDLRAPLRSIDGYSKILQEDYTGNLDEEGRRVLNVIMSNAKRMGKLIDDLLDFGRLGRKSIQRSRFDMTGMVRNIVNDLIAQEPGRRLDIKVGQLHPAFADADMMRQVWFNLLENAVKYTGKKEVAMIEVRSYQVNDGEVYYEVKDNGEGFDMKYAHKLFGVFQRLHKMQDFAGTGVGLAIVKRIISRHSGRVWAEASLHRGAIFYFTIPD